VNPIRRWSEDAVRQLWRDILIRRMGLRPVPARMLAAMVSEAMALRRN